MFTEIEQETLDIDWFFTNGTELGFVASGGGRLPRSIAEAEDEYLLADDIKDLPISSSIVINPDLEKIIGSKADKHYLLSFVFMAERGFFNFDKTVLSNFSNTTYHWVAKPTVPLTLDQLPDEVAVLINRTKYSGDINADITFLTSFSSHPAKSVT